MSRINKALFCYSSLTNSVLSHVRLVRRPAMAVSALSRTHLLAACPYSTTAGGQEIPRYPVPPLRQTVERFLQTAKPLLDVDRYQHATKLSEELLTPGGLGEKLQKLLEQRANNTINWLEEWWLNIAYLEYRLPVTIHVNPGISTPRLAFRGVDQQLRHAANVIVRILEFKKQIDTMSLPLDTLGGSPLCMKQFYRILGCCRVPRPTRDDVIIPDDSQPSSKHITVLHKNHIFSLDVYNAEGQPLSSGQLYAQLQKIINQSQNFAAPIGILTTEQRDTWSQVYKSLSQDEVNKNSLSDIHRSICVLCLDQSALENVGQQATPRPHDLDIDTIFTGQVNHGGGSKSNTGNRWFDKIFQVFISPDGMLGFNYEHSAAEGPPIVQLADHCYQKLNGDISEDLSTAGLTEPRKLEFNITDDVHSAIISAGNAIDKWIDKLTLVHYKFDSYGKDQIKKLKASPDAFIQVAFQLAYYRLHGKFVATYESGSLRKFQHGRTDTIRSCTAESKAYCKAMDRTDIPAANKIGLLRSALNAHRQYTDHVINGRGIDRHMLGLKLIALENGLEVPRLLNDPVYTDTATWRISTSQVASKSGGLLSFGPVVDDGYGICYNPMDNCLLFAVSSWNDCRETDARRLASSIGRALKDARNLLEQSPPQSKL